jgi:hypothetical protein
MEKEELGSHQGVSAGMGEAEGWRLSAGVIAGTPMRFPQFMCVVI